MSYFDEVLYFNSDKYNFWPIYDCISKFYPLGLRKEDDEMYLSYPGIKAMEALIEEHFHNSEKRTWTNFSLQIETKMQHPVIRTTYGQAPCYSLYIELEKTMINDLTRLKELHCFVSLLGPFYTIIGQDRSEVKIGDGFYSSTNCLIISPQMQYAQGFQILSEQIEKCFENFRFVPFNINRQHVQGLKLRYTEEPLKAIFNAIFNDQINLKTDTSGDEYYKYDDWIKDGYVDEGGRWVAYPPVTP